LRDLLGTGGQVVDERIAALARVVEELRTMSGELMRSSIVFDRRNEFVDFSFDARQCGTSLGEGSLDDGERVAVPCRPLPSLPERVFAR
jgi:hypothetical protein